MEKRATEMKQHKKLLPYDTEAEEALLAGVFINNPILDDIMPILAPEDFYRESNCLIFTAMRRLYEQGKEVDAISVRDTLLRMGSWEKGVRLNDFGRIVDAVCTSVGFRYWTDIIRQTSIRRRLIQMCQEIASRSSDDMEDVDKLLDEAEQKIFSLAEKRAVSGLIPVRDALQAGLSIVERACEGCLAGLVTGFSDLDFITGGLQSKDLIILAGRPGMGKTALALSLAYNVAKSNRGVAFFSLEMSKEQVGLRLASSVSRVDQARLRSGRLRGEDRRALIEAAEHVSSLPIFIDETPSISVLEMKAKIRRLQKRQPLGLCVVDYLQLMQPGRARESRANEVAEISAGLKSLAKSFDLPVLALAQLNRRVEDRPKKRPELADLRDSGNIEQDADVILFVFRPEAYGRTDDNAGKAELIIAKQRNGPVGAVKLTFIDRYAKFENLYDEKK